MVNCLCVAHAHTPTFSWGAQTFPPPPSKSLLVVRSGGRTIKPCGLELLGAGRGVQAGEVETPAMAAEAGRETRRGAESDEESDGCDGAQDSERVGLRNAY